MAAVLDELQKCIKETAPAADPAAAAEAGVSETEAEQQQQQQGPSWGSSIPTSDVGNLSLSHALSAARQVRVSCFGKPHRVLVRLCVEKVSLR